MIFANPFVLWLLPLALLPLLLERTHSRSYSWVAMLPTDPLSNIVALFLKLLAVIGLLFILLGLAGPQTPEQQIEKIGVATLILTKLPCPEPTEKIRVLLVVEVVRRDVIRFQ